MAMLRLRSIGLLWPTALAIAGLFQPSLCPAASPGEVQPKQPPISNAEKNAGIRVVSLRPTGGGQMLDLRFQVIEPEKAKTVLDKKKKAYLLDGKTGKTLPVPVTKAGPMRQSTPKPEAGRIYFILFSNPGGMVKEGSRVSLVIGDFRKDDIIVDASGAAPGSAGAQTVPKAGGTEKP
jgi:hypothetical protein